MKIERISSSPLEIRRSMGEMEGEAEKELVFIEGYAAVWNSESKLLSEKDVQFIEVIAPMAFTKALENLPTTNRLCGNV